MTHLTQSDRDAVDAFIKQVSQVYPDVWQGNARRRSDNALEVPVVVERGMRGDEPIHQAANEVLVTHGVYIVPNIELRK